MNNFCLLKQTSRKSLVVTPSVFYLEILLLPRMVPALYIQPLHLGQMTFALEKNMGSVFLLWLTVKENLLMD